MRFSVVRTDPSAPTYHAADSSASISAMSSTLGSWLNVITAQCSSLPCSLTTSSGKPRYFLDIGSLPLIQRPLPGISQQYLIVHRQRQSAEVGRQLPSAHEQQPLTWPKTVGKALLVFFEGRELVGGLSTIHR
jgi:hypothetical protein